MLPFRRDEVEAAQYDPKHKDHTEPLSTQPSVSPDFLSGVEGAGVSQKPHNAGRW